MKAAVYVSPLAEIILRQRGLTVDTEPATRPAAETKLLTAREKLEIYMRHRPRNFTSAAEANEAEHREIALLNAVNRERWS
jgi:hypothetical protein